MSRLCKRGKKWVVYLGKPPKSIKCWTGFLLFRGNTRNSIRSRHPNPDPKSPSNVQISRWVLVYVEKLLKWNKNISDILDFGIVDQYILRESGHSQSERYLKLCSNVQK